MFVFWRIYGLYLQVPNLPESSFAVQPFGFHTACLWHKLHRDTKSASKSTNIATKYNLCNIYFLCSMHPRVAIVAIMCVFDGLPLFRIIAPPYGSQLGNCSILSWWSFGEIIAMSWKLQSLQLVEQDIGSIVILRHCDIHAFFPTCRFTPTVAFDEFTSLIACTLKTSSQQNLNFTFLCKIKLR